MKSKYILLLPVFLFTLLAFNYESAPAKGSPSADEVAVKAAIENYVLGLYDANTDRIHQSIHPELRKRGFWYNKQKSAYTDYSEMTFEQLVDLTSKWNVKGNRANKDSVKEITIYEVLDKTATAKLTAVWGTDYFHLGKIDGQWMILNVLWQSPTPD